MIRFACRFRFVMMKGRCHDGTVETMTNANPDGSGKQL
jgi:hypothetical protein